MGASWVINSCQYVERRSLLRLDLEFFLAQVSVVDESMPTSVSLLFFVEDVIAFVLKLLLCIHIHVLYYTTVCWNYRLKLCLFLWFWKQDIDTCTGWVAFGCFSLVYSRHPHHHSSLATAHHLFRSGTRAAAILEWNLVRSPRLFGNINLAFIWSDLTFQLDTADRLFPWCIALYWTGFRSFIWSCLGFPLADM